MNPSLKEKINKNILSDYLDFAKINEIYNKYLKKSEEAVFNETESLEVTDYKDGASIKTGDNFVTAKESGIVIFSGEKEGYGKTIIIQQADKIDVWYGNLKSLNIGLYDYVKKGDVVGEIIDSNYYIVFQKDGKFLDYKKYL